MLAKKILNKLLAKCIIHIFMPNLYSFCYMFIYKCIYKALNVFLWMIPCRKKVLKIWWSTRNFNTPFAGMSVLLKDFVFA